MIEIYSFSHIAAWHRYKASVTRNRTWAAYYMAYARNYENLGW